MIPTSPLATDLAPIIQPGIDACTLNNALNVAQLVVLALLLRRLQRDNT